MLDWVGLISNGFWIVALALALATFGFASWQATIARQKLRCWLAKPSYQFVFSLAGFLFCTGLAIVNLGIVQTLLWTVLAILFLVQAVLVILPVTGRKERQ